jgi:ribosome-associated protein
MTKKKSADVDSYVKALKIAQVADAAKAENIVVLDVRRLSNVTDYFIICTGTSQTHIRAIGKRLDEALANLGIEPERVDGYRATNWIVFDYGTVILHAMMEEARQFYDLERLWGDAPRVKWNE